MYKLISVCDEKPEIFKIKMGYQLSCSLRRFCGGRLIPWYTSGFQYKGEDAELFHCTRTSGIYASDHFSTSVTGADCNMTIGIGIAWIRNRYFAGKVVALKEAQPLDLGLSDAVFPRIDAVVIRFDANTNKTEIVLKKGTAASEPVAPGVERTEAVYELHLYHVRRAAGSAVVTAADVTDLRLSAEYCGLMADSVTRVDTAAIQAQVEGLISRLEQALAKTIADGIPDHTHNAEDIQGMYASAKGSAASLSLTANTITQLHLDTWVTNNNGKFVFDPLPNGDQSIHGIRVPKAGVVMVYRNGWGKHHHNADTDSGWKQR